MTPFPDIKIDETQNLKFGNFEGIWNLGGSGETSIWAQNLDLGPRGECP